MKIITFEYTDLKGKKSQRDLLVTSEPSDKFSGIDLSELPLEELPDFRSELEEAHQAYMNQIAEIKGKYDMVHSYRQFLADRITNLEIVE